MQKKLSFLIFFRQFFGIVFLLFFSPVFLCSIEYLSPIVINKLPHDPQAFTQGLAIHNDELYESTGLYGHSSLRHLDIHTGKILHIISLSPDIFCEGIAILPNFLFQITWLEKKAFIYRYPSLELVKTIPYEGEGWGLCQNGSTLWMSNGSSVLTQRSAHDFSVLKTLRVHLNGKPVKDLNDLECVGNYLYANILQKNWIVQIDSDSGEVKAILNMQSLLSLKEKALLKPEQVLNGIAYRPSTDTFFITGKQWPWLFEVRFPPI